MMACAAVKIIRNNEYKLKHFYYDEERNKTARREEKHLQKTINIVRT